MKKFTKIYENNTEKLEDLYFKFIELGEDFGREVEAEGSHGNGIYDKNSAKDFVEYFGEKLNNINKCFNDIKREIS